MPENEAVRALLENPLQADGRDAQKWRADQQDRGQEQEPPYFLIH
jgi:hypothetical protein